MALQSKTITGSTNNSNWTWKMEVIENSTNTSANTSSVTVNSYLGRASSASYFGGNASVNITCNGEPRSTSKTFTYPTNVSGGGWVLVQSETFIITHNSDGSKDISISSSMSTGDFTPNSASASGSMTLTKIPRYAKITSFVVNKRDETSVSISWGADATCDYAWYSKNNGSSWSALPSNNIVTGLSANTSYNFKLRVRRKDSQLTTDSSAYKQTTYDYPYCTESPNFTIGNALTLKFYNPLGRTISVKVLSANNDTLGSWSGTSTSISGFNDSGSVAGQYASIPNSKSGTYKVQVVYGSVTKTRNNGNTYSINENACIPTVGDISYKDTNENTIAITEDNQRIIRNHSNLLFTIGSAIPKNSASISKYEVTIGGVTKSRTSVGDLDFGTLNLASSSNATLKVTDSRGISNTKQINVVIDNWELPTALIELKRKNNFYSETYFKVDGSCSYLNGKNELNIKYQYKKINDTNYSELIDIEDNTEVTIDLDNNYQWNLKAIIIDKLGSTTYNAMLERGMPITFFDRNKNSMGINCFPKYEENVELNGETLKGSIVVSDAEPTKGEEVWLQKGKNLFDPNTHIELIGQFRDKNSGNITSATNYYGLKIPVTGGKTYITKCNLSNGNWSNLTFFDTNMNYISGNSYNGADKTFTTPSNCSYVTIALGQNYTWFSFEEYIRKINIKNKNNEYECFSNLTQIEDNMENLTFNLENVETTANNALSKAKSNGIQVNNIINRITGYGEQATSTSDPNNLGLASGFYRYYGNCGGLLANSWWFIIHMGHYDANGNFARQVWFNYFGTQIYTRYQSSGTWKSFKLMLE